MTQKLIFLDIDGTLMLTGHAVPDSAREACRRARKNGHRLFIASGRTRATIGAEVLDVGFDGVISGGGAAIEIEGKTIFTATMPRTALRHVVDFLAKGGMATTLELADRLIAGPHLDTFFAEIRKKALDEKLRAQAEFTIEHFWNRLDRTDTALERGDVQKVVYTGGGNLTFEEIYAELSGDCEVFRGSISIFGPETGEIGPKGVHKGSGIERVAAHFGVDMKDTFAFGDSDNDSRMIMAAGVGVAMGNADEEIKNIADYITGRIENDGLFDAFAHFGLL
jgi:Cof subfamily protein (haloacid dehalogenase superfamily)